MPYLLPLCLLVAGIGLFYDSRISAVALLVAGVVGLLPMVR